MSGHFSSRVGSLDMFYSYSPKWGLLYTFDDKAFLLLISSFASDAEGINDNQEVKWMVHVEDLQDFHVKNKNKFTHDIFTSNAVLFNNFSEDYKLSFIDQSEEKIYVYDLHEMCLNRSLYYSSDASKNFFRSHMSFWQKKYNIGITFPFFDNSNNSF